VFSAVRKEERHRGSVARGLVEYPLDERLCMLTVAVRRLAEDGTDSANAHWLLIEHRRKVVLHGAGKHVATLH
jgi:hypothetical protein